MDISSVSQCGQCLLRWYEWRAYSLILLLWCYFKRLAWLLCCNSAAVKKKPTVVLFCLYLSSVKCLKCSGAAEYHTHTQMGTVYLPSTHCSKHYQLIFSCKSNGKLWCKLQSVSVTDSCIFSALHLISSSTSHISLTLSKAMWKFNLYMICLNNNKWLSQDIT